MCHGIYNTTLPMRPIEVSFPSGKNQSLIIMTASLLKAFIYKPTGAKCGLWVRYCKEHPD